MFFLFLFLKQKLFLKIEPKKLLTVCWLHWDKLWSGPTYCWGPQLVKGIIILGQLIDDCHFEKLFLFYWVRSESFQEPREDVVYFKLRCVTTLFLSLKILYLESDSKSLIDMLLEVSSPRVTCLMGWIYIGKVVLDPALQQR